VKQLVLHKWLHYVYFRKRNNFWCFNCVTEMYTPVSCPLEGKWFVRRHANFCMPGESETKDTGSLIENSTG
jgi:hypothetical protein